MFNELEHTGNHNVRQVSRRSAVRRQQVKQCSNEQHDIATTTIKTNMADRSTNSKRKVKNTRNVAV